MALVLAFLALVGLAATGGPEPEAAPMAPEPATELLIELPGDAGSREASRVIDRLQVIENGQPRVVSALQTENRDWRIVLYFDQFLAGPVDFRNAALELAAQTRALVGLGPVEIVMAGEEIRTAMPATQDPLALSEALSASLPASAARELSRPKTANCCARLSGHEPNRIVETYERRGPSEWPFSCCNGLLRCI